MIYTTAYCFRAVSSQYVRGLDMKPQRSTAIKCSMAYKQTTKRRNSSSCPLPTLPFPLSMLLYCDDDSEDVRPRHGATCPICGTEPAPLSSLMTPRASITSSCRRLKKYLFQMSISSLTDSHLLFFAVSVFRLEGIMPSKNLVAIRRVGQLASACLWRESVAVLRKSPRKLLQSASLTSCEANGCGRIGEGGGKTGNPASKCLPLAIKYIGGKSL